METQTVQAGSTNTIYEFEDGERIFRCNRGEPHVHRGEYAQEDWLMCNCPHAGVHFVKGEDSALCVDCGKEIEVALTDLEGNPQ